MDKLDKLFEEMLEGLLYYHKDEIDGNCPFPKKNAKGCNSNCDECKEEYIEKQENYYRDKFNEVIEALDFLKEENDKKIFDDFKNKFEELGYIIYRNPNYKDKMVFNLNTIKENYHVFTIEKDDECHVMLHDRYYSITNLIKFSNLVLEFQNFVNELDDNISTIEVYETKEEYNNYLEVLRSRLVNKNA